MRRRERRRGNERRKVNTGLLIKIITVSVVAARRPNRDLIRGELINAGNRRRPEQEGHRIIRGDPLLSVACSVVPIEECVVPNDSRTRTHPVP